MNVSTSVIRNKWYG